MKTRIVGLVVARGLRNRLLGVVFVRAVLRKTVFVDGTTAHRKGLCSEIPERRDLAALPRVPTSGGGRSVSDGPNSYLTIRQPPVTVAAVTG